MSKPLAIDLFCGLGGWAHGFLAEGYDVVGFDVERHVYGDEKYPAQLVLQDVLTLHGSQFRNAAVIVASPPCQAYSYRAMPWKRAKALPPPDNSLFEACFRIAGEAGVPLIVENVRGAQPWVGHAGWHFGSYYLWGDIPALMPIGGKVKIGGSRGDDWFTHHNTAEFDERAGVKVPGLDNGRFPPGGLAQGHIDGLKVPGVDFSGYGEPGYKAKGFNVTAAQRYRAEQGNKGFAKRFENTPMARVSSRSDSRKAASAQIAKIPFPLAQHIARVFKPDTSRKPPTSIEVQNTATLEAKA